MGGSGQRVHFVGKDVNSLGKDFFFIPRDWVGSEDEPAVRRLERARGPVRHRDEPLLLAEGWVPEEAIRSRPTPDVGRPRLSMTQFSSHAVFHFPTSNLAQRESRRAQGVLSVAATRSCHAPSCGGRLRPQRSSAADKPEERERSEIPSGSKRGPEPPGPAGPGRGAQAGPAAALPTHGCRRHAARPCLSGQRLQGVKTAPGPVRRIRVQCLQRSQASRPRLEWQLRRSGGVGG